MEGVRGGGRELFVLPQWFMGFPGGWRSVGDADGPHVHDDDCWQSIMATVKQGVMLLLSLLILLFIDIDPQPIMAMGERDVSFGIGRQRQYVAREEGARQKLATR